MSDNVLINIFFNLGLEGTFFHEDKKFFCLLPCFDGLRV